MLSRCCRGCVPTSSTARVLPGAGDHAARTRRARSTEYTERVAHDPTTCVVVIRAWWEPDFRARIILDTSPESDANAVIIASVDDLLDTLRAYLEERRP